MKLVIKCATLQTLPDEGMKRFAGRLALVHQMLGEEYRHMVQANFEGEHEPDGTPWQPLSPVTANSYVTEGKRNRKKRGFHPILRVSGHMSDVHVEADEKGARVGTNLPYAPIHQFGGKAGRGRKVTIPARPWLFGRDGGVPEQVRQALLEIIEDEVRKCLS